MPTPRSIVPAPADRKPADTAPSRKAPLDAAVQDPTPHRGGHTTPQRDGEQRSPRLPHERDESSDSQPGGDPGGVIQQAHDDLERGLVDTDRGPVLDRLYEASVRPAGEATRDRGAADGTPDETFDRTAEGARKPDKT